MIKHVEVQNSRLYRYISLTSTSVAEGSKLLNRFIKSLQQPCLYTSKPAECNDPFEFKIRASDCDQTRGARWYAEQKVRTQLLATSRIICFSKRPDDLLMWSRYGAVHTGVVLEFRSDLLAYLRTNQGYSVGPIHYMHKIPTIQRGDPVTPILVRKLFFTKSKAWAHEQEVRAVLVNRQDNPVRLPEGMISAVILGAKSSYRLRRTLWEKLKETPAIILKQAVLGGRYYRVRIYPYDPKVMHFNG